MLGMNAKMATANTHVAAGLMGRRDHVTEGSRLSIHDGEVRSVWDRLMRSVKQWIAVSALAASALVYSPGPALANWQYTQWGMSPDQVTAASNVAAKINPDRALDAGNFRAALTAPYQGSSIPFTAVFLFDPENKLEVVTLNPIGGIACPVIVQALEANHGAPEGDDDMVQTETLRWDDVDNNNLIVFADLGEGKCMIQYSKLPPTRANGKSL